jgi:dihydroorotate dehydrogenase electron transfer subunit
MPTTTIRQIVSEVIENKEVAEGIFRLALYSKDCPERITPGQFVMIRTSSDLDPLLRRAFSIHDHRDSTLKILYKVVGRGTDWMSRRHEGERVDLVGPLGRGFHIPGEVKQAWLVAGGIGVAPFQLLSRTLDAMKVETALFYGTRTAKEMAELRELPGTGRGVYLATEDGSRGAKGRILEVFREEIRKVHPDTSYRVYACGPDPMLAELAQLCQEVGVICEASLETWMACGIGTCMGCVTQTRHGYQRVCREGPVFKTDEIIWK